MALAPGGPVWFGCPGCDRVVTGQVLASGPSNQDYYSQTHCCRRCERGEGHGEDGWECAGIPQAIFRVIDVPGRDAPAHYILHTPVDAQAAPAVLFLHGGVTYVYPESLWLDVRSMVEANRLVRERFVVIAPFASAGEPLAVVSDSRTKTTRYGVNVPYVEDFDEDLVWAAFMGACRALGPGAVDPLRLSVVGYSMGGQAVWNLSLRYGSRLAAAVPFAGCCSWRGDAWSLEAQLLGELRQLALRAYHGEADTGTYSWRDFSWLAKQRGNTWEPTERTESHVQGVDVSAYEWSSCLQLFLVRGTQSCHCCWDVVLQNEESFHLFSWLESLRCASPVLASSFALESAFPASCTLTINNAPASSKIAGHV